MARTALTPLIGPAFDQFLGASIGASRNGTTVSMLSALARLDVDPWQEAAALTRMPKEAAKMRLAALLAALPHDSLDVIPGEAIAGNLVALLPTATPFPMASPAVASAGAGPLRVQARVAVSTLIILVAIAFALSLSISPKGGLGTAPSPLPVEPVPTVSSR